MMVAHPTIAEQPHCAFCTKPQREGEAMLAGAYAYICGRCVVLCADWLKERGLYPCGAAAAGGGEAPTA